MIASLDWAKLFREFADRFHWLPAQVLDMPIGHLWAFIGPSTVRMPHDPERVAREINKNRAKHGLPPMKPRNR